MTPIGNSILDRIVRWCFYHWLAIVNGLVFIYGGLPWLSPLAMAWGYPRIGQWIFHLYTPFCHQIPARSFFLLGHQVAFCHREAAMYTSLFIGGLFYASIRHTLKPTSWQIVTILLMPMALDGTTHLISDLLPSLAIRSSYDAIGSCNWWLRIVSGVLFALAVLVGIYPRLERDSRNPS